MLGTQEMWCVEQEKCPACTTRDVLRGTHEMSCVEHKRCPAWNTRDVLRATHEMSCLEPTRCPAFAKVRKTYNPFEIIMIRTFAHSKGTLSLRTFAQKFLNVSQKKVLKTYRSLC